MKAYLELKVNEEREDFPSEEESSSSEEGEEETEDEADKDMFVLRGFMSDSSGNWLFVSWLFSRDITFQIC